MIGKLTLYWDVKDPEVTIVHVGAEKRSSGGPLCANALVPFIVLHQWNHIMVQRIRACARGVGADIPRLVPYVYFLAGK